MQIEKTTQILVFDLRNDGTFECIGEINQYDSLIWGDAFAGSAAFELWAPIVDENRELLKDGYILWCGGDNAATIMNIKTSVDKDGSKKYNVKGKTLEHLLDKRIVWGTYSATNKDVSTVMYEVVRQSCVSPVDSKRKLPFLELDADAGIGGKITTQKTGGSVLAYLTELASAADIGFCIKFDPRGKRLVFCVEAGVDRTVQQTANDPVEFSTDLEDILSSSYYMNSEDHMNVAWVQGEGEGAARVNVTAGESAAVGFDRLELYVDARDLQKSGRDENNKEFNLTDAQYRTVLIQRGLDKLSDYTIIENFEANIRVFGDVQYVYGEDYFKGDKVTVRDNQLGVVVSARITNVEEDFDEEYNLVLTFGYQYPTVLQKVNRAIN